MASSTVENFIASCLQPKMRCRAGAACAGKCGKERASARARARHRSGRPSGSRWWSWSGSRTWEPSFVWAGIFPAGGSDIGHSLGAESNRFLHLYESDGGGSERPVGLAVGTARPHLALRFPERRGRDEIWKQHRLLDPIGEHSEAEPVVGLEVEALEILTSDRTFRAVGEA